jgi:hypothetical protein
MRRTLLAVTLITLAVATTGATYAEVVSLLDVIPADATVVMYARDVPGIVERWPDTPFVKLWNDPEVKRFFAPLRAEIEIDRWDDIFEEQTGYRVDKLLETFTGDLVLYMPGLAVALAEEDEGIAPLVVIAAVGDGAAELERAILRKQSTSGEEADEEDWLSWEAREFSGVEMHVGGLPGEDGPEEQFSWAVVDNLFALTSSPSLLERVISDIRRESTADPLASSTAYTSVSRFLRSSDVSVYVDAARLMPLVRTAMQEELSDSQSTMFPVDPDALYDALGLETLRAAFAGMMIGADGLSLDLGITHAGNRGLVKLLAYGPGDAPRPRFIPPDTATFGTAKFDFQTSWLSVEEILNGVSPALLAMAGAQITAMTQNAGVELDLRRDVLDNLAGDIVVVQSAPTVSTPTDKDLPMLDQSQVIGLEIRQRQSFELALETLKTLAGQGSELFEEREYLDTTIYSLKMPQSEGIIAYALTDDYFLLSFGSTAALESVLVSMGKQGESAWSLRSVRRALAQIPPGAAAVNYQNLAVSGNAILEGLAALSALNPEGEFSFCDPAAIPDPGVVGSYLGPAVSGIYRDETSIIVRSKVLPSEEVE